MVGEFFSGGVCQKENGENCSAEAVMDGRLTGMKGKCKCIHVEVGVKGSALILSPCACSGIF